MAAALVLTGCLSTSPRVVKIGFVAPFEGRYREIGEQVIPAARFAVREYAARFPNAEVIVELVAYDDQGSAELAAEQAKKLVADPEVKIVIGHWRDETTQATLPIYQKAGLPLITFSPGAGGGSVENLSPSLEDLKGLAGKWGTDNHAALMMTGGDDPLKAAAAVSESALTSSDKVIGGPAWALNQFHALVPQDTAQLYFVGGAAYPADQGQPAWTEARIQAFTDGFKQGSLGAPPGLLSVTAYEATWLAINRIARPVGAAGPVSDLSESSFDPAGRLNNAPVYLYRWDGQSLRLVMRLR